MPQLTERWPEGRVLRGQAGMRNVADRAGLRRLYGWLRRRCVALSQRSRAPAALLKLTVQNPSIPACLLCGVCCHSHLETYVRVTGADWQRLGADAERLGHFIGNRAFMRMHAGHCAALDVRPNVDGAREFFCTIYENRPQVCRDLARGSPACEGELWAKGDRTAHAPS